MSYNRVYIGFVRNIIWGINMKDIKIIEFKESYHEDLRRLSYEWLNKYDLLEPEDEKIINDPIEVVIEKGGYIFFAKYEDEIVGTVSLIKIDESTFEVAKLAVTEKYQGLKIGSLLMEKCISFARNKNYKKLILFTNTKLNSAQYLYGKFNFREINIGHSKYMVANRKMELKL